MSQQLEDPDLESRSNMILGVSYYFEELYAISNDYYRAALASPTLPAYSKNRANIHSNMGVNHELLGQYGQALASYRASIEIDRQIGDERNIGLTLINQALIYNAISDMPRMRESLLEARRILEPFDDTLNQALIDQNLSIYHNSSGQVDSLLWYAERAESAFERLGYLPGLTEVLGNQLHHFTVVQPDPERTREIIRRLLAVDPELRDGILISMVRLAEARLALMDGDLALARTLLEEGQRVELSFDNPMRLPDYYREWFRIASMSGDVALAERTFEQWRGYADSVRIADRTRSLEELEIRFGLADAREQLDRQASQLALGKAQNRVLILALAILFLGSVGLVASLLWRQRELRALYRVNAKVVNPRSAAFPSKVKPVEKGVTSKPNTDRSAVESEKDKRLFDQILELFETEHLHRDSSLTIAQLAVRLLSNETYVSKAIRNCSGENYNTFVNRYRVNDAKEQLGSSPGRTIDSVMQHSGFHSRSTFFKAFRQETGLTPAQYRQLSRQKASA